jgi:hypothetical protein
VATTRDCFKKINAKMMEIAALISSVSSAATAAAAVAAIFLICFWWFLLRPRPGGRNAPPLVSRSTVVPLPLIGHIAEFFKSPNEMVKRCYRDYGSIFTIPVRACRLCFCYDPPFLVSLFFLTPNFEILNFSNRFFTSALHF